MLNLWCDPPHPSVNVTLSRIMNFCSKEILTRLCILVMLSYLQENKNKISLMNHKNKKKKNETKIRLFNFFCLAYIHIGEDTTKVQYILILEGLESNAIFILTNVFTIQFHFLEISFIILLI